VVRREPSPWHTRVSQVAVTAYGGFRMYWGTVALMAGLSAWEAIGVLIPHAPEWRVEHIAAPALLLVVVSAPGAILPARRAGREEPARLVTDPNE